LIKAVLLHTADSALACFLINVSNAEERRRNAAAISANGPNAVIVSDISTRRAAVVRTNPSLE
jgi:hypothetical protein